jgi:hypothetical protein
MNMQPPKPMKPQGADAKTTDPQIGHEIDNVNVTGVFAFIVFLMFSGIVIFALLYGVFHFATNYALKQDQQDMRDPWIRSAESKMIESAKKMRTAPNRAEEPGSMEMVDAESRIRVTRFPQPRLQTDDVRDLALQREAEDVYLNQYFVLDKNSGRVNIPIEQAMQRVVHKGLPAMHAAPGTQLPQQAETTGVVRPAIESSHAEHRGAVGKQR